MKNEKQKVDEEWEKMIEKERMEVEESIKKKNLMQEMMLFFLIKKYKNLIYIM